MRKVGKEGLRTLAAASLAGIGLTFGSGIAQADPWDNWIPGVPGPGVNIGIPGNPLPPGQVKQWIDDLIPNFGKGKGKWK